MKEIKVGSSLTLTAPEGATGLEVRHELDNELVDSYTFGVGETTHAFTPDSIGVHKVVWLSGTTEIKKDFYSSVLPLVSASEFFASRPELESFEEQFAEWERKARFKIEQYTNQRFGPYHQKTITVQGDDGDTLVLPMRLTSITSISDHYGYDFTDTIMIAPGHDGIIQYRPGFRGAGWEYDPKRDVSYNGSELFSHRKDFTITGNWGWEYVPAEVTQAAILIIEDGLGGGEAVTLRQQGVQEAQLGDFRLKLDGDKWGTTGNSMADTLLGGFINYRIELI